jgi:phospholipid/cholesterol/gamma-HCH transport system substrate-binding protein
MAQRQTFQIGTGLFILLGFGALAYLATQTTSLANYSQGASYSLKARFTNVGQLKLRAPVKIAGVRVGTVSDIKLEADKLDALVTLAVDQRFKQIPDDSAAAVFTSGLLGDQYVALQPGGSPEMFKDGDEVVLTQSSMQLEELIGKYLVGSGDSAKPGDKTPAKPEQKDDAKSEQKPEAKSETKPDTKPAPAKPSGK